MNAKIRSRSILKYHGMEKIGFFLEKLPKKTRVVGIVRDPIGAWLPVRYESMSVINWSRHSLMENPNAIRKFLNQDKICYVILPIKFQKKSNQRLQADAKQAIRAMVVMGDAAKVVTERDFILWKVNNNENLTGCRTP